MPRAKKHKYGTGSISGTEYGTFRATVSVRGEVLRKSFATRALAEGWLDAIIANKSRPEQPLTETQYRDAQLALAELPQGVTLLDAVRAAVAATTPAESLTVALAIAAFLKDKLDAGMRPRSISSLKYLVSALPETEYVSTLTTAAVAETLTGMEPTNRNNHLRAYRNFFGWCRRRGYCTTIPTEAITRSRVESEPPGILTPAQCEKLLAAATQHDPALVPYLAIGAFAGLRTAELDRLNAAAIDTRAGHIHVGAGVAKIRLQRYVEILPTLKAWLKAYPAAPGPIRQTNHRRRLTAVKDIANVDPPANALRHSFATYHLALYQDSAKTAHELGHQSAEMLYNHYRNLATKAEANRWFSLMPGTKHTSNLPE